jgi:hypothetical protein
MDSRSTELIASKIEILLTDRDVERITRRARKTLQKDRLRGGGIPFIRLGRLVRYRQTDVAAWIAARPSLRSTSDTSPSVAEVA